MAHAIVLPAAALVAGVLAAVVQPWPDWASNGLLVLTTLMAVREHAYQRAQRFMVLVAAGCACGGLSLGSRAEQAARDPPALRVLAPDETSEAWLVEGVLSGDAQPLADSTIIGIDADRVRRRGRWEVVRAGISLTVGGQPREGIIRSWRAGRRARAPAWLHVPARYLDPGVPDHRLALARRGVVLAGTVKSAALVEVLARGSWLDEAAAVVRDRVRQTIHRAIGERSPPAAAIVIAVLIGDRTGLEPIVERTLQEAGTYHVIAISGGNIAILAACLLAVGRVTHLPWRGVHVAVAVALAGYAVVAGGGSSVARATIMAVVYLGARALDQQGAPAAAVAVAAATLAAMAPLSVLEPAFGLTFAATVAILVVAPRLLARLPAVLALRVPAVLLTSSLAAEVGVLPLGAWYFSRITVAGLLLNFAAIPLMAAVQVGGMAVVLAGVLSMPAARAIGSVPLWAADALVSSAGWVRAAPWAAWRVPPPPLAAVVIYYAAAGLLAARSVWPRVAHAPHGVAAWALAASWIAAAAWIATAPSCSAHPGRLRVVSIDVGQGDATLLDLPDGHRMLVDAGGLGGATSFDVGERVVVPTVWALGVRALDYLVVTHGDADHAGGAASVVTMLQPREVWEGVPVHGHALLTELHRVADEARVAWRTLQAGDVLQLGSVRLEVLNPRPPDWERRRVRNADSVVLDVQYGDVSVLLMGDADTSVEPFVETELAASPLRVLKVGHHGSRTSSSPALIRAGHPVLALISCGRRNRFGHPAPDVLRRLEAADVRVFRTDRQGAIELETDGHTLSVETFTGEQASFSARSAAADSAGEQAAPRRLWPLADAVQRWLRRTQEGTAPRHVP